MLKIIQATLWLTAEIGGEGSLASYVHCPSCCQNTFLILTELVTTTSSLTSSKVVARDFHASEAWWPAHSVPNYFPSFGRYSSRQLNAARG